MGLRSRTLACAATRARQIQTTTAYLQHFSTLYRSHGRLVGVPPLLTWPDGILKEHGMDISQACPTQEVSGAYSRAIIAPIMSLALGQRLGPYEVVSPIGAGGMGEVYRARDTRLERIVALKILP